MGIVNKLPMNLKRAWVEYTIEIEQQTGERAKFLDLSKLVAEKSRIANSIFGIIDKRFKLFTNLCF